MLLDLSMEYCAYITDHNTYLMHCSYFLFWTLLPSKDYVITNLQTSFKASDITLNDLAMMKSSVLANTIKFFFYFIIFFNQWIHFYLVRSLPPTPSSSLPNYNFLFLGTGIEVVDSCHLTTNFVIWKPRDFHLHLHF